MKVREVIGRLVDTPLSRGKWVIVRPMQLALEDGRVLDLEPYMITDYASAPRVFWRLVPMRDADYDIAAAWHDFCVRWRNSPEVKLTLMECHAVFLDIMRLRKVPAWKRKAMYWAVVGFNWMIAGDGHGRRPNLTEDQLDEYVKIVAEHPWRVEVD